MGGGRRGDLKKKKKGMGMRKLPPAQGFPINFRRKEGRREWEVNGEAKNKTEVFRKGGGRRKV